MSGKENVAVVEMCCATHFFVVILLLMQTVSLSRKKARWLWKILQQKQ